MGLAGIAAIGAAFGAVAVGALPQRQRPARTTTSQAEGNAEEVLRRKRSRILYLDHVQTDGRLLFDEVVKMDLEGIVCKRKDSPYKVT